MTSVICTLAEDHFIPGVCSLLNSLCASGFTGTFICAYKGSEELWSSFINQVEQAKLTPRTLFRRYEPTKHYTHQKAALLRELHGEFPQAELYFYFDPDIVQKCSWSFMEEWAQGGIAVVEDVNSPVFDSDPRKRRWKCAANLRGLNWKRATDFYVNAGFIGVAGKNAAFLEVWQDCLDFVFEHVPDTAAMKHDEPTSMFHIPDQDALNIAIHCFDGEIAVMPKSAMDFQPGGFVMSHAIGAGKPWQRSFLLQSLRGSPPRQCDRVFLKFSGKPLHVWSPVKLASKSVELSLAAFISRFYRRN